MFKMAKIVVKSKVKKVKRKFPVEIVAPSYLSSKKLGNSNITDLNSLVGKTSKVNLMYITGNMRNQNIRLVFKITEVSSGLAKTEVKSYAHIPYYLRRFVKPGSEIMEDSFVCTTKDGLNVRIKPFLITKVKTSSMVITTLRNKTKEMAIKEVSKKNYADFISSVIFGKEQNIYKNELKKIAPIKVFEFKKIELN